MFINLQSYTFFPYILFFSIFAYHFGLIISVQSLYDRENNFAMNRSIKLIIALSWFVLPLVGYGQTDSTRYHQTYQQFKEQAFEEYYQFQQDAFNEFERFLGAAWTEYQGYAGLPGAYPTKKPEFMPTLPTQTGIIDVNAPSNIIESIITDDGPGQKNEVFTPDYTDRVAIEFYGRQLAFNIPRGLRVAAQGNKERHVAAYHEAIRKGDTIQLFHIQLDAAVYRMGLNEWGYFILLRNLSEKLFTAPNDRVLFTFYMLHRHGFKARVGRGTKSDNLLLLLALDNSKEVYSKTFFRINDTKFYAVYGNGIKGEGVYTYDEKADDSGLKEIGLDFDRTLSIAACDKQRKLHLNKVDLDINLPYSTAHLRYYDEIPTTVFPVYFKTPVSREAEQVLEQVFSELSDQYNKVQLVDIMLNFVQTAFAYKIDELQFGREKYFFPEEVIGLPFSDCEDRSALFAWLVKRFVGYDVIGVLYDDHLATAVCFDDEVQLAGKKVTLKGKRYVICDPTYPNAPIGTVLPKVANMKYEIIEM